MFVILALFHLYEYYCPPYKETDSSSPGSNHGPLSLIKHVTEPSPLAVLQTRLTNPTAAAGTSATPIQSHSSPVQSPLSAAMASVATLSSVVKPSTQQAPSPSPLLALANSLSNSTPPQPLTANLATTQQLHTLSSITAEGDDDDDEYD